MDVSKNVFKLINRLIKQFRKVRVIKPDLHDYVTTAGLTD